MWPLPQPPSSRPRPGGPWRLSADRSEESLDVTNAVGPARSPPPHHFRDMIRDHRPAKINFVERLHQLEHVRVAMVDKRLDKVRDRRRHIAKVNFPELVHFRELPG